MLVLISFGLVLVATVLLVLGLLFGGGLGLIYASIACSLAAGIALVVATVIRRPGADTGPRPAPAGAQARDDEATSVSYASAQPPPVEATAPVPVVPAPAPYTPARRPAMATVGAPVGGDGGAEEDFFPIEDYDDLGEAEILPLVPELYEDELDMVEARERETKARAAVLDRIDEVRRGMPAEGVDDGDEVADVGGGEDFFPIEDYDELKVAEILPLLPELYADELDLVERRERAGRGRVSIINRIADLRATAEAAPEDDVDLEEPPEMGEPEADMVPAVGIEEEQEQQDEFFPIEDYDELTVGEILPLLPELYDDELDMVEDRERATKNRREIIDRLAELRDPDQPDGAFQEEEASRAEAEVEEEDEAESDVEVMPVMDDEGFGQDDEEFFPIEDYDELTVGEILPLLPELYEDELDVVEDRERATKNRSVIINRLAELRDPDQPDDALGGEEAFEEEAGAMPVMDDEEFFPIEDYDELTVGEILPLLPELYEDELDVVEDRERATKNRAVIISRLAELRTATEAQDEPRDESEVDEGEWEVPGEGWDDRPAVAEEDLEEDEVEEDLFPIADYDQLRVAEIRRVLPELSEDELEVVRDAERRGANRITILTAIDRELGVEAPPPVPAVPARKAVIKKAPTKKAPAAKKAPAKRSAPTKKAPAAKKAPTKKEAVTKVVAKKAPTKKVAAKKVVTKKKAGATKAVAKRSAPAKKAGATKAGAVKRTAPGRR